MLHKWYDFDWFKFRKMHSLYEKKKGGGMRKGFQPSKPLGGGGEVLVRVN